MHGEMRHSLPQVNLPSGGDYYTTTTQAADEKFFDQLLCIESSQNPDMGPQYAGVAYSCRCISFPLNHIELPECPDPPAGNAGSNAILAACPAAVGEPSPAAAYQQGGPIFVLDAKIVSSQPLTVPFPAFSSQCTDSFQPGFLEPIPLMEQVCSHKCELRVLM